MSQTYQLNFDNPATITHDSDLISFDSGTASLVDLNATGMFFANYDTVVRPVGEGFNQRSVGSSHGKRLMFTQRRAAYDAKARFNIPDRMELSWEQFWSEHQTAMQKMR